MILHTRAIFLRVLAIFALLLAVVFIKAPILRTQERAFNVVIPTFELPDFTLGPAVMNSVFADFFAWQSNRAFCSEELSFHGQGLGAAWSHLPNSARKEWLQWAARSPFPRPEQSREFISNWVQAAGSALSASDLAALDHASKNARPAGIPMNCIPSDITLWGEAKPYFLSKFATVPNFVSAMLVIFAIVVIVHQRRIVGARKALVEYLDSGPNHSMHQTLPLRGTAGDFES